MRKGFSWSLSQENYERHYTTMHISNIYNYLDG